jgi:hypothetical protein
MVGLLETNHTLSVRVAHNTKSHNPEVTCSNDVNGMKLSYSQYMIGFSVKRCPTYPLIMDPLLRL